MVVTDEDAVICDFLQYYQVMDYRALPLGKAAILACGLPADSRIMKALAGSKYTNSEIYQMMITDELRFISYMYRKIHFTGKHTPPERLIERLVTGKRTGDSDTEVFDTPEAFEAARNKIIKG